MHFVFIGMLLLLWCATPVRAQVSTQIAAANREKTYGYLKSELSRLRAGIEDAAERKGDGFVPLTSCGAAVDYLGEGWDEKSIVSRLAELAYDVLYMQEVLTIGGYPESIWKSDIADYERRNLATIEKFDVWGSAERGSPEKRRLSLKFNEYKKNTKGRFKRVQSKAEGCGAGEIPVKITTDPPAQRVQYINVVKYNLCAFQGVDPESSRCNNWIDYAADGAAMSGKYKVRVTWKNKPPVCCRDLDVDSLVMKSSGEYAFPISQ